MFAQTLGQMPVLGLRSCTAFPDGITQLLVDCLVARQASKCVSRRTQLDIGLQARTVRSCSGVQGADASQAVIDCGIELLLERSSRSQGFRLVVDRLAKRRPKQFVMTDEGNHACESEVDRVG
jgi:hypothetical protein